MMTTRDVACTAARERDRFGPAIERIASAGAILMLCVFNGGCAPRGSSAPPLVRGVEIDSDPLPALHDQLSLAITSAPARVDWKGGLVGAMGGARVSLIEAGEHEIITVLPQSTETQIPLAYGVSITPLGTATKLQLCGRPATTTNVVVSVRLHGNRGQEVQVNWSAVMLVIPPPTNGMVGDAGSYRRETACAQSSAEAVKGLADQLWPADGALGTFAVNIQDHIRDMQQRAPPRSMDAVGILESGGNWICTANANLATALLRARGVPARSLAVIPPTGQRLEMHRIIEYFDNDQWQRFDPSSIHRDVPMKHWQTVVMATTTPEDEDLAMQPRMGSSLGVPYGQELEFTDGRLTFAGPDFFWTIARPLAGFEADEDTIALARKAWNRFLEVGRHGAGPLTVATATNAAGLRAALQVDGTR